MKVIVKIENHYIVNTYVSGWCNLLFLYSLIKENEKKIVSVVPNKKHGDVELFIGDSTGEYVINDMKFVNHNMYGVNDLDYILKVVCDQVGMDIHYVLTAKTRKRKVVYTRHLFWLCSRVVTLAPYQSLADMFNMHHATVISGISNMQNLYHTNDSWAVNNINELCNMFNKKLV